MTIYRTAYIVQNTGHNFQELRKVCDNTVFLTDGLEYENEVLDRIVSRLKNFDPTKDIIVPVGNVTANMLTGLVISFLLHRVSSFTIAMFQNKEYHLRVIQTFGMKETIDEILEDES